MNITVKTNKLRRISITLFILSVTSLLGSLWLHNTLVNFQFTKTLDDKKISVSQNYYKYKVICSENTEDCKLNIFLNKLNVSKKLGDCFENEFEISYLSNNNVYNSRKPFFIDNNLNNNIRPEFIGKEIEVAIKILDKKKDTCIKNSKYFKVYKIFPFYFEILYYLKNNPKTSLGTSEKINPFIYGETSISNIVKRFPVNVIFKSFLFISVLFMYLYWKNYKSLLSIILNSNKNKYFYFGVASAIFLFFHVLFLGMDIDNKYFKTLRKLIIAFFILSELLAQYSLTIQLFKNKKKT